jgi:hypothetical protein
MKDEEQGEQGATVAGDEEQGDGAAARRRKKEDPHRSVREKRVRSTFKPLTGHAPRPTGRAQETSDQSLVRSRVDRTRPVRDDQTLTESGSRTDTQQRTPGQPDASARFKTDADRVRSENSLRAIFA